jgi:prepilin-type N-terminal cleavage/methylation domain-containing protein
MRTTPRSGFTLIELLTVMSLIAVLGGLGIYFLPSFNDSARAAKGAGQLQNWLQIARTRAMRDDVPTGIRILSANPGKFQYIAQPDDFSIGQASIAYNGTAGSGTTVQFLGGVDLFAGDSTNPSVWPVQIGDYIEFLETGLVRRIVAIPSKNQITLSSDVTFKLTPSGNSFANSTISIPNYRIMRQPRIADDEILELPQGIVVEASKSFVPPSGDIVFSPNGAMLTPFGRDRAIFWVRDGSRANVTDGEPTLIVVFARTGLTSAFPVDTGSANPYAFAEKY